MLNRKTIESTVKKLESLWPIEQSILAEVTSNLDVLKKSGALDAKTYSTRHNAAFNPFNHYSVPIAAIGCADRGVILWCGHLKQRIVRYEQRTYRRFERTRRYLDARARVGWSLFV